MENKKPNHRQQMLPLDEISSRLAGAILSENILNKDKMPEKIRSILKVWLRTQERPLDYDNPRNSKPKTDMGQLRFTIEKEKIEKEYWMEKVRILVGKENMQPFYDEMDAVLETTGHTAKDRPDPIKQV